MDILVSKDSKGKIRVVKIWADWSDSEKGFVIHRITSQYKGKETVQPEIIITKGKAKRTITEQKNLELNSHIKKYLDKGYKKLPEDIDLENEDALNELIGVEKTGQDGVLKPMLAKQADKVANSAFEKEYYGSRKINGLRCLIYKKGDRLYTASRGSINYDLAIHHILFHPKLVALFEEYPDLILDGEIYKHGWTLNKISGLCRTQVTAFDGEPLEFYLYDVVRTDLPFEARLEILNEIADKLELKEFEPYKEWDKEDLKIQMVPQEFVSGWLYIKKMHDDYVSEGWEGLVIRNTKEVYGPGKRSNAMIKIKNYLDATFKVVRYELGLRGSEDMVFICETPEGKLFKASPMGDRLTKEVYVTNFEDKYINQLGDCKYFEISPYGIPQQPKFVAFRIDL